MAADDDVIGPWSEDKLGLLRKYLAAYVSIMRGQPWCKNGYHYIDAFAGSGRPRSQDYGEYVDGSPRVALSLASPFTSYTFVEQDPYRVQKLQQLQEEFPDREIRIFQGDCNQIIPQHITCDICFERYNRGFVFLDPFALSVDWETVQAIAATRALEILMNIPTMAINRTALLNNPEQLTDAQVQRMNRFWGTTEWRGDIYEQVPTLFDETWEIKTNKTTARRLGDLYRGRLSEIFPHVTYPLVMRNAHKQPIYCLIFAGHKSNGAKITEDIFNHYEKLGV